jgi:hypothetical protein
LPASASCFCASVAAKGDTAAGLPTGGEQCVGKSHRTWFQPDLPVNGVRERFQLDVVREVSSQAGSEICVVKERNDD